MGGWLVLGIILIVAAYFFGRIGYSFNDEDQGQSDYAKMNEAVDTAIDAEDNKTRNLLIKTLKDIGCQPETDNNDRIHFKYQGEAFQIAADNEHLFIVIWDVWWGIIEMDDSDIPMLKEAVNQTNLEIDVTVLYSIDEEQKILGIHSKHYLPFTRKLPAIEEYLRANLDLFFVAHQVLKSKIHTLHEEQIQQDPKERVIIKGFNIQQNNE